MRGPNKPVPHNGGRRGEHMNIRKKLAVAAAVALPVTGLVVLGGTQLSAAGGPPILSCSSLGSTRLLQSRTPGE